MDPNFLATLLARSSVEPLKVSKIDYTYKCLGKFDDAQEFCLLPSSPPLNPSMDPETFKTEDKHYGCGGESIR